MYDVVPSFYGIRDATGPLFADPINGNYFLRIGRVVAIKWPEETGDKLVHYDVLVEHSDGVSRENKLYMGCILANAFGGFADKAFWTLRTGPDASATSTDTSSQAQNKEPALGSRVLVLCVDGVTAKAVILSGLSDIDQGTEVGEKAKGHHAYFVFNGVKFSVNDDGSWEMMYGGKTGFDGKPTKDSEEKNRGTTVKVDKTGSLTISTNSDKEQIKVDHVNSAISIKTEKSVTIQSDKIYLGNGAKEKLVLGNKWADLMSSLIDALSALTVPTAVGPSGPPINTPQITALKAKLQSCLSDFVFTKKKP